MKMILICLVCNVFITTAYAEQRTLELFEIGKKSEKPVFMQKTQYEKEPGGITKSMSTMFDAQGNIVMTEQARFKDDQLIEQTVENKQLGENYQLKVENQHLSFQTTVKKPDGKTEVKTDSDDIKPDQVFLSGPTAEPFLRAHWDDLYSKDLSLHVRFGILERGETVGFKFSRHKIIQENGKEIMVVRMRPTSPFLALLVDPSDLYFDVATQRLVHYRGRTPLVWNKNGKQKPFDSEIEYHY